MFQHRCISVCFQVLPTVMNTQGSSHGLSPFCSPSKAHCNYTLKANEKLIHQFHFKTQFSSLTGSHALHRHMGFKHSCSSKYGVFDAVKHAYGFQEHSIKSALKFVYCTLWKLTKTQQHYLPIHLIKTKQCSQHLQTQDHKQGSSIKILLPIHITKILRYFTIQQ